MFELRITTFMQALSYAPIRDTFFECHIVCSELVRNSFERVATETIDYARSHGLTHIVELGAGTAPISELIAERDVKREFRLSPCDAEPETHQARYRELTERFPGQVTPVYEPVDYTEPRDWGAKTLLLVTGTFPALPAGVRVKGLRSLTQSSEHVMVREFVRKTPLSAFLASCTFFTGLMAPLYFLGRPGTLRRVFWCWLLPLVPLMCAIDGIQWSLRCWTDARWRDELEAILPVARRPTVSHTTNSQLVAW